MKVKKTLWIVFGVFFTPLVCFEGYNIYFEMLHNNINLKDIGLFILMFELVLASVTAFYENGHFPIRYLLIFIISALIFNLSLNKGIMDIYSILTHTFSIILFSITYIYIKILNKKYTLLE